eukprot:TRINITY_DN33916_c0_g1_i1.p1 TRINITY_DN33916_c0_g1~~TRINITY_DN33916_c0_g1_i1.p1  ORF type:complete len:397 (+),score=102.79 TRINITY_DN33916_c0_g1_i1:54-1193(+)
MVLIDRDVTSYPEYADVRILCRDWGLGEAHHQIELGLDKDWWFPVTRTLPYSQGSTSSIEEVYIIVKRPYGGDNYKAESGGKVLYVGKGDRKEVVFSTQQEKGKRKLVVQESNPVKSFYLRYKGESYRGYRYFIQLNYEGETKNKVTVHQFLQEYLSEAHPVVFPSYFKVLVDLVKNGGCDAPEIRTTLLKQFKKSILAFRQLQKAEHQALQQQQQLNQQISQGTNITVLRSDLPTDSGVAVVVEHVEETPPRETLTTIQKSPSNECTSPNLLDFDASGGDVSDAPETDPVLESILQNSNALRSVSPAPGALRHQVTEVPNLFPDGTITPPPEAVPSSTVPAEADPKASWIDFSQQPTQQERKKSLIMDSFKEQPMMSS